MAVKRLVSALLALCFANAALAGPWLVGQQPTNYSAAHTLGDNSNARGGEAPFYVNSEVNDIATNSTILTNWFPANCSASDTGQTCGEFQPPVATFTGSITTTTLTVSSVTGTIGLGCNLSGSGVSGGTRITAGSGTSWTVNNSQSVGSTSMSCGGLEAKARFDCNISFHEKNDPIIAPGVANGSTHDHSFFGAFGFQGQAQNITYSGLRNGGGGGTNAGYSTCYGGPMNRTLYWEPSMEVAVNGVTAVLEPFTIVTYYVCGDGINLTGAGGNYGPPNCSRWPRDIDMIFGFNMSDPTDTEGTNRVAAANASYVGANYSNVAQGQHWYCANWATPSYTAYSPNQTQGASQPYFNDGNGHQTINCTATQMDGVTTCTLGTANCGYVVVGDLSSADCWDGKNNTSPNGRGHLIRRIRDNNIGGNGICPDTWYFIPHFEAKPEFLFTSLAELQTAYLSSDRMPGMTQFAGGQSLHADLKPAWDYGTGDNPGAMLRFFQNCLGLSMHVKNSDGVTYTNLTGNPHECGFARVDGTHNLATTGAPPDGLGPNPVVQLAPDQSAGKRYFPLANGTPLPGSVIHTHP